MPTVAEIRAAGLTHLRKACDGCNCVFAVAWQLMPRARSGLELDDVRRRLRCSTCGCRPAAEAMASGFQAMASGFQVAFKA